MDNNLNLQKDAAAHNTIIDLVNKNLNFYLQTLFVKNDY